MKNIKIKAAIALMIIGFSSAPKAEQLTVESWQIQIRCYAWATFAEYSTDVWDKHINAAKREQKRIGILTEDDKLTDFSYDLGIANGYLIGVGGNTSKKQRAIKAYVEICE